MAVHLRNITYVGTLYESDKLDLTLTVSTAFSALCCFHPPFLLAENVYMYCNGEQV